MQTTALFTKMKVEIHFSLEVRGKFDENERLTYVQAKKEFLEGMDSGIGGIELVRAAYNRLDSITDEYLKDNPIVCHAGCGWCCYQLICCTTLEMELIVEHIKSCIRNIRRDLVKRIRKEAFWLNRFYQAERAKLLQNYTILRWEQLAKPMQEAYYGKRPCPFLNQKKECSIYPVRPIDCRIAKTDEEICGQRTSQKVNKMGIRLFADQIASDVIMDEENKIYGERQVVPLAAWALTERFNKIFF